MIVVSLQVVDGTYFCKRFLLTQAIIYYIFLIFRHFPYIPRLLLRPSSGKNDRRMFDCWPSISTALGNITQFVHFK